MKIIVMQVGMLSVNCYIVVSDSQNAAVIDPGGEAERILDYLQTNKLTLKKNPAYPWTYRSYRRGENLKRPHRSRDLYS